MRIASGVSIDPVNVNAQTIHDLVDAAHWLAQHPELPPVAFVVMHVGTLFRNGPDDSLARDELKAVAAALDDPVESFDPFPPSHLGNVKIRGEIGETVRVVADAYADDLGAERIGPFYRPILAGLSRDAD